MGFALGKLFVYLFVIAIGTEMWLLLGQMTNGAVSELAQKQFFHIKPELFFLPRQLYSGPSHTGEIQGWFVGSESSCQSRLNTQCLH